VLVLRSGFTELWVELHFPHRRVIRSSYRRLGSPSFFLFLAHLSCSHFEPQLSLLASPFALYYHGAFFSFCF